jgi:hypothetical protein
MLSLAETPELRSRILNWKSAWEQISNDITVLNERDDENVQNVQNVADILSEFPIPGRSGISRYHSVHCSPPQAHILNQMN